MQMNRAIREYEAYLEMEPAGQWAQAARARIAHLRQAGRP